jgi:hypothetical protein
MLPSVISHQQAPACKAALQCLGQVLCAVEPSAWLAAAPGFQLLLSFSTEARPKIRKRAAGSVQDVLGALQGSPASLGAASEAVLARELQCEAGTSLVGVVEQQLHLGRRLCFASI